MRQPSLRVQDYEDLNLQLDKGLAMHDKIKLVMRLNHLNTDSPEVKRLMDEFTRFGDEADRPRLIAEAMGFKKRLLLSFWFSNPAQCGDLVSVGGVFDNRSEELPADKLKINFSASYIADLSIRSYNIKTPSFLLPIDKLTSFKDLERLPSQEDGILESTNPNPSEAISFLLLGLKIKSVLYTVILVFIH